MVDVKITYETLFDLLRREQSHAELQMLDENFYNDVISYLKEKQAIIENKGDQSELFGASEGEKVKIQFENVKKIIKELYEKREKKILQLALNKVRTGSNIIDTSTLLKEEQKIFEDTALLLSRYKSAILERLLRLQEPDLNGVALPSQSSSMSPTASPAVADSPEPLSSNLEPKTASVEEKKEPEDVTSAKPEEETEQDREAAKEPELPLEPEDERASEQVSEQVKTATEETPAQTEANPTEKEVVEEAEEISEEEYAETKIVRILSPVPKFVGKEKEIYGPFEEDEVANLPAIIADILVKKGRAEEMQK